MKVMKVILYANVSLNGQVLLSENQHHQVPMEIIEAAAADIRRTGNLIMGRKSFENFEKAVGGATQLQLAFPNVEMVWLSARTVTKPGRITAHSPEEAIQYLSSKGFREIIVGGGPDTYAAFLEKKLITDVLLNVVPLFTVGGAIGNFHEAAISLKLVGHQYLTPEVIQLQYQIT